MYEFSEYTKSLLYLQSSSFTEVKLIIIIFSSKDKAKI